MCGTAITKIKYLSQPNWLLAEWINKQRKISQQGYKNLGRMIYLVMMKANLHLK